MNDPLNTPWKITNDLIRRATYPYLRLLFYFNHISWGKDWRLFGVPIIQKHRKSTMSFGAGLGLRSLTRSNPLGPNHPVILCTWSANSLLEIGLNFAMTGGALCAAEKIVIGNYVNVGANTTIIDTDFHPLDPELRRITPQAAETSPVLIEDDVFIGMNCLILKGVTIGKNTVVGAGSVVTHDLPSNVIAAGNPAKVLREL